MPHCTKCGTEVAATAQFCPTCGQPQPAMPAAPHTPAVSGGGITENTAAALSYVLGWITGIIFFLIDKRPYVRFHAAQSIVTFGLLHLVRMALGLMFGFGFLFGGHRGYGMWGGFGIGLALLAAFGFFTFTLWLVCIIKAATGSRFVLPISGPIAENLARK